MANFLKALNITLRHEGGYANDPDDKGGETYQGIARAFNPDWAGWGFLDSLPYKAINQVFNQLNSYVADFYHQRYWLKNSLDQINSDQVANAVFDWLVNSGGAAKQIQLVLNSLGNSLVVDGLIGRNTIAAINRENPSILVNEITSTRVNYYRNGADKGWFNQKYLTGLVNRAEQFKTSVVQSVGKPPKPGEQV